MVVVNAKFWLLSNEETQSFIKVQPFLNNSKKNGSYSEKNPCNCENYDTKKSKVNNVVVVVCAREEVFRCFEQNIGPITAAVKKEIDSYLQKVPADLIQAVIEYSALSGAKSWKYVKVVLDSCIKRGIRTKEELMKPTSHQSRPRSSVNNDNGLGATSIDFDAIQQYIESGGR